MARARISIKRAASAWVHRRLAQMLRQAAAAHVFQGQVRPSRVFDDLENLHDMRVRQLGRRLGLTEETRPPLVIRFGVEQALQGGEPAELAMSRLVNDAHAAAR